MEKIKTYADMRNNARKSNLKVGGNVLVQQPKENKLTTPFDPKSNETPNKTGTVVTARREDKAMMRNSMFFKPIRGSVDVNPATDESKMENAATQVIIKTRHCANQKENDDHPAICRTMFVNNMCKQLVNLLAMQKLW